MPHRPLCDTCLLTHSSPYVSSLRGIPLAPTSHPFRCCILMTPSHVSPAQMSPSHSLFRIKLKVLLMGYTVQWSDFISYIPTHSCTSRPCQSFCLNHFVSRSSQSLHSGLCSDVFVHLSQLSCLKYYPSPLSKPFLHFFLLHSTYCYLNFYYTYILFVMVWFVSATKTQVAWV